MRVALVTARHPSARGGAEVLYDGLQAAVGAAGHDVSRVEIPFDESTFEGILAGYREARALDLSGFDAVISTKAPTFAVRHPRHVVYLVHTIRVFYDMYDSWTDGSAGAIAQRDRVRELDASALMAVPDGRRFAIGTEVERRVFGALGLDARVLHPALPDPEAFRPGPFEHVLLAGRLHAWKRPGLVLEAYLSSGLDVPLVITGAGPEEGALKALAAGNPRVRFLGEVDRETLSELFSRALAVPFAPVREDFGYVTVEAMLSAKPVVTTHDAGEAARLVEDGRTGLVVSPDRDSIGRALERLARHPEEARRLGDAGRQRALPIRWPRVVEALLGSLSEAPRSRTRLRPVILDNQPIEPPVGGGRLRLAGLYAHLPEDLDPVYVGTYDWRSQPYRAVVHGSRLLEITVPQSEAHFAAHEGLLAQEPALSVDVTFPMLSSLSHAFEERLAHEARAADVIVLSHPWALPALRRAEGVAGIPIVYDAQNVEGPLRQSLLGSEGLAGAIAADVEALERELCRAASAVLACSPEDAQLFRERYGVEAERLHVVPNGVDTSRRLPPTSLRRGEARLRLGIPEPETVALFVGSRYPPNADAARFIARELAPRLPDVRFLLVGGSADEVAEAPRNVSRLGAVDEGTLAAAYDAADLALNPMSRGSGTNIKMLEFFAVGLPTATTAIGARGLLGADGEAYDVLELPAFAGGIRSLLSDPGRRARMGAAARRLAETSYDWRVISASVARVLRAAARGSRDPVARPAPLTARPRLALMSTWKARCGIADYAELLASGLPATLPWTVYAESHSCTVPEAGRVYRNWEYGLANLVPIERALERDRVDVLLAQHNPAFFGERDMLRLMDVCARRGVRAAFTFHAAQGLTLDPATARRLSEADAIFVHRQSDVAWLAAHGVSGPVRVIPQGIPRLPERSRAEARRLLGRPEVPTIGHFGFLRPHKGTLELIEAFEVVASRVPGARLLLAAAEYPSPDSAAYRAVCAERIAASPFRDRIDASWAHRPLAEAGLLLQACDLIVYPYHASRESSSAAVRLGIASRRAVLVSASDIFEELRGVAAEAADLGPAPLADQIVSLLSDGAARRACELRLARFAAASDWGRVASLVWGHLRSREYASPAR